MCLSFVTLTMTFDGILKNISIDHNYGTLWERAVILHICSLWLGHLVGTNIFILWPWLWPLTYIWKIWVYFCWWFYFSGSRYNAHLGLLFEVTTIKGRLGILWSVFILNPCDCGSQSSFVKAVCMLLNSNNDKCGAYLSPMQWRYRSSMGGRQKTKVWTSTRLTPASV